MPLPRAQLHQQFVQAFADGVSPATPVPTAELDHLATVLGTVLPAAYREFILHFGAVRCPDMHHPASVNRLGQPSLFAFLTPRELLKRSEELWCQYLPVDIYLFAADGLGNGFCFRKSRTALDDAPVMFLTRQSESLHQLCDSFDRMLHGYLARGTPKTVQPI